MNPENRDITLFLDLHGVFKNLGGIAALNRMIQKFRDEGYPVGIVPVSGIRTLSSKELQEEYEKAGLQKGLIFFRYATRKMGAGDIICEHIENYNPAAWAILDDSAHCYAHKIPAALHDRIFVPKVTIGITPSEVTDIEATLCGALSRSAVFAPGLAMPPHKPEITFFTDIYGVFARGSNPKLGAQGIPAVNAVIFGFQQRDFRVVNVPLGDIHGADDMLVRKSYEQYGLMPGLPMVRYHGLGRPNTVMHHLALHRSVASIILDDAGSYYSDYPDLYKINFRPARETGITNFDIPFITALIEPQIEKAAFLSRPGGGGGEHRRPRQFSSVFDCSMA